MNKKITTKKLTLLGFNLASVAASLGFSSNQAFFYQVDNAKENTITLKMLRRFLSEHNLKVNRLIQSIDSQLSGE